MGIARSTSSQASGKGDSSAADSRQLCESTEPLKIQYVIEAQRPAVSEIRVPTKDGNASVVRHGAHPPRGLEMFDGDANAPPQISEHALSELLVSGHSREVNLMGTGYTKVAVNLDVPGHHFRTLRLTDLAQPEHAHGLNAAGRTLRANFTAGVDHPPAAIFGCRPEGPGELPRHRLRS